MVFRSFRPFRIQTYQAKRHFLKLNAILQKLSTMKGVKLNIDWKNPARCFARISVQIDEWQNQRKKSILPSRGFSAEEISQQARLAEIVFFAIGKRP